MNRIDILCEQDSSMMHEFSRRSLDRISGGTLLSMARSFFSTYMQANVRKEIEKDRLIIEEAAAAYEAGRPACDLDLEDIFEKTKGTDSRFLEGLMIPSFSIVVHYGDFADIRIQRIWRISKTVYALLGRWPEEASFADAAKASFSEDEFRSIIGELLHLYSMETRMLGEAIRSPFRAAISAAGETLFRAMEEAKEELANDCAKMIYERPSDMSAATCRCGTQSLAGA